MSVKTMQFIIEVSGDSRMNPGNTITGKLKLETMPGLDAIEGKLPLGKWKADDNSPGCFGTSGGGGGSDSSVWIWDPVIGKILLVDLFTDNISNKPPLELYNVKGLPILIGKGGDGLQAARGTRFNQNAKVAWRCLEIKTLDPGDKEVF